MSALRIVMVSILSLSSASPLASQMRNRMSTRAAMEALNLCPVERSNRYVVKAEQDNQSFMKKLEKGAKEYCEIKGLDANLQPKKINPEPCICIPQPVKRMLVPVQSIPIGM